MMWPRFTTGLQGRVAGAGSRLARAVCVAGVVLGMGPGAGVARAQSGAPSADTPTEDAPAAAIPGAEGPVGADVSPADAQTAPVPEDVGLGQTEPGPTASGQTEPTQAAPGAPSVADLAVKAAPKRNNFRTANTIDGRVGTSTHHLQADPLGQGFTAIDTFAQVDWDGIGGSAFGFHLDGTLRLAPFQQPSGQVYDKAGRLVDCDAPATLVDAQGSPLADLDGLLVEGQAPDGSTTWACSTQTRMYRGVNPYANGRHTQYLRLDRLYATFRGDVFEVSLGRRLIDEAALAQVDGVDIRIAFGRAGLVGIFGGLKANPWHQQIVGARGGPFIPLDGRMVPALWGTTEPDPSALGNGAESNDLFAVDPLARVMSSQFLTAGLYGSWRHKVGYLDAAFIADMFRGDPALGQQPADTPQLDRLYTHLRGGTRVGEHLSLWGRMNLDFYGAAGFRARDAFIDATWRDGGPITASLSYMRINTVSTALSYANYFRPLEGALDQRLIAAIDTNLGADLNSPGAIERARVLNYGGLAQQTGQPINNALLYEVNRDRVTGELAWAMVDRLELVARGRWEHRDDKPLSDIFAYYNPNIAAVNQNAGTTVAAPTVPAFPQHSFAGTLGLRDTFLGGAGAFDASVMWIAGYRSQVLRAAGHLGVNAWDHVWLEIGGSWQQADNDNIYVARTPDELAAATAADPEDTAQFTTRAITTQTMGLEASAAWRVAGGLSLEASYQAFTEDVPYQGQVGAGFGDPQAYDTAQTTQTGFARVIYRY